MLPGPVPSTQSENWRKVCKCSLWAYLKVPSDDKHTLNRGNGIHLNRNLANAFLALFLISTSPLTLDTQEAQLKLKHQNFGAVGLLPKAMQGEGVAHALAS